MKEARQQVGGILAEEPEVPLVLLGTKVSKAFDVAFQPFTTFRIAYVGCDNRQKAATAIVLPHPSGLCRLWNEPGALDRAAEVLRREGVLPQV